MSNPLVLLSAGKQSIAWRRWCYPTCGVSQPVPTIIALMEENFDKHHFLSGSTAIEWQEFVDWKLHCFRSQSWLDMVIAPSLFILKVMITAIYFSMKITRIWNQELVKLMNWYCPNWHSYCNCLVSLGGKNLRAAEDRNAGPACIFFIKEWFYQCMMFCFLSARS